MYPKIFFENFWDNKQRNELFVCMPFDNLFDEKFEKIRLAAKYLGFEDAKMVKEDWAANEITDKIIDGIANSKTLLFDLSDDPNYPLPNENVLYELGIATAVRESNDILLIREGNEKDLGKVPFDVRGLIINFHTKNNFTSEWFGEKLKKVVENQKWYKSRRTIKTSQLLDEFGLILVNKFGLERQHFNTHNLSMEEKISALRLLDIGLIWFAVEIKDNRIEWAYHWTDFGYEVAKILEELKRNY